MCVCVCLVRPAGSLAPGEEHLAGLAQRERAAAERAAALDAEAGRLAEAAAARAAQRAALERERAEAAARAQVPRPPPSAAACGSAMRNIAPMVQRSCARPVRPRMRPRSTLGPPCAARGLDELRILLMCPMWPEGA